MAGQFNPDACGIQFDVGYIDDMVFNAMCRDNEVEECISEITAIVHDVWNLGWWLTTKLAKLKPLSFGKGENTFKKMLLVAKKSRSNLRMF